MKTEQYCI